MSKTIDERIVEMRFDNKQFESNVATSMNTLDKLKKSLHLDEAARSFDSLSDAAKKCDMSMLGRSVEAVSSKFSVLETIAVGALLKIGSQIATTGEQLVKSMTIDQVAAGWEKYADKTTAVQTIISATGKSIDEVNDSLEKLIWFTDETSYSMTDMTSNIGKFTSQGVELDTAVTAMEGISTWASLSGGSINEASRAMYNLSQALGVGAVKLMDWKSIENANMATREFKEMAIEAAVATGDLTKSFDNAGNAIYKTSKGTEVSVANFSSTLQDAWFSSDALIAVLNNYGGYADGVYELYNNLGEGVEKTTSEIIQDLKNLKGADDDTILSAGYTQDQIELVRRLSEEVGGVGQKSFAAAQEAKTFSEVLTSVKEAVSSGWAQTFETIFGNYEEAKILWTDLANELYDVFAEGGNARNELLKEALSVSGFDKFIDVVREAGIETETFEKKLSEVAKSKDLSLESIIEEYGSLEAAVQNGAVSTDMLREAVMNCAGELSDADLKSLQDSLDAVIDGVDELTGREHLISAFWNTWEGARTLLATFKDAFREIFPAATSEQIFNFARGLDELTGHFRTFLTESEVGQKLLEDLKNTFKGVFAVLDIVKQAFSALWRVVSPSASVIEGLLSGVLGLTGGFGEWISGLDQTIRENDIFYNALRKIVDFLRDSVTAVKNFGTAWAEKLHLPSLDEAKESVRDFLNVLKEKTGAPGLEFLHILFERIGVRAGQLRDTIVRMKDGIVDSFAKIDGAVSGNKFIQVLSGIWTVVKNVANAIGSLLGKTFDGIINTLSNANFNGILDFLNALAAGGLIAALKKFLDPVSELKDTFDSFTDWAKTVGSGITDILDNVRGCLEAYQTNLKAAAIGKIAAAIAVLAGSLLVLSFIDSGKIAGSLAALTALFVELTASLAVLDKLSINGKAAGKTATAIIEISAALLILSLAMKNLGELNPMQLTEGLIGIGVLLAEIDMFLNTARFDKNVSKTATGMILFAAAIKILVSAVKDFAGLSWEDTAKGLTGIGVLLAEVDVFLNTAKFSGKSVLTANGIILLASSMKILASACKTFGEMGWETIAKGLTSVGALLLEITAFTRLTGDAKHVISTGLALIEIGAAMKILASAISGFGGMDWTEIAKGLVAMGGALAEVAIASNLMPKNMISIGTGLVIVGAALKMVAGVLGKMGGMSWEEIAKGLVVLGGALTELSIGLNLMNGTLGGSAALLMASSALFVLTPALKLLGGMSWESIVKGLVTVAGAFTVLGVAGAVLTPLIPSILGLSAALTLIGVGSVAIGVGLLAIGAGLTSISVGLSALATSVSISAASIVAGLSAVILGIAGLIPAIAEKIGEAIIAFCGAITGGATAIGEAAKTVILTLVNVLVECVPAVSDGILTLIAGVLASLVKFTPQIIDSVMQFLIEILEGIARNMPQLIQSAMNVVGAFFAGILNTLSSVDTGILIQGIAAVGLLTALIAGLGAVAGLIPAALVGVAGMGVAITELALVLAAVGALAQIPGLEWLIGEGGQLLQTIGTAIGGFVGSIVGSFINGVSGSFPQIGADLSTFMTNIQPFIDGANHISADTLTGVKALTEAIMLITAADLLKGLTSWLTGGSSLSDFGNELLPFGEAMIKFSDTISGLDADLVDKAATAGKALAEMADTLPKSGGVIHFFTGEKNVDEFGKQLVAFGRAMMRFADTVNDLDADTVQNAAIVGKTMAEMAAALPNTGGAVEFFTGNNDMTDFAKQLVPFGNAVKAYGDAVAGLEADAVVNSATAGAALVELARTLPNTGGAIAFFTGDNDLATFGEQIVIFGNSISVYSQAVADIDSNAVTRSADAGAALVELADTIPRTGGLVSFFTGVNDLGSFAEHLVPFGIGMKAYSDNIAGFNQEAVAASIAAAQALANLQNLLPDVGGVIEFFTGGNDLGKFAEGLVPFGQAMKEYGESVSDLEQYSGAIDASVIAGTALSELSKTLPNAGGVVEFFTGGNDLSTFAAGIISFGNAMRQYGEAVSELEQYSGAIQASVIAGESLVELSKTLPNVGGVLEFFTGSNDLGLFSTGMITFGNAMRDYGEAVANLEQYSGAVEASVIAGSSLIELSKTLPNTGSVLEFFTGSNDLGAFSVGIITFGQAMSGYGEAVNGLEQYSSAVEASVIAGSSLIELSKTLPNTGGVISFFTGGNDLGTFAAGIVPFGTAMREYGAAVSGLESCSQAIEASVIAGNSLIELSKTLPGTSGVIEFFTGQNGLTAFGSGIVPFGTAMRNYGEAVTGLESHAAAIEASVIAGKSLVELSKTLPNADGAVSFFTGKNDLGTFAAGIVPFGTAMRDYADVVSGLEANSGAVAASAIAGKSLAELANTLPSCGGLAQVFTGSNNLASFGNELVQFGRDLSAYAEAVKGVQADTVTASANAAQALSSLASGLPDSSLFDKWFGSKQSLAAFGKDISAFGTELSNYNAKVGSIDTGKLSGVITQVWSLIDLAKGINSIDTGGFASFGKSLKSMADSGIKEFTSAFENAGANINKAVQSMLKSVSNYITASKNLTTPGMESVMKSLADIVVRKASEINTSVIKMMTGVCNTIRNSSSSVRSAMQMVMSAALSGFNSGTSQFYTAGANAGQGFINGINSKMGSSTSAGRSLGLAALNAAKQALDSHSPSREFIHLGENMGEGLAIGAKNSIVPAAQATSYMIDEVLKVSAKGIDAFRDWAEEKKYYSELSLKDELAGYEKLQIMYAAGSEERKKIDREVYRIQNELVASTYQASINWIDEEKYYNRLSTQEELAAYEKIQKRYMEGSEQRMAADRKVYALRKQLIEESYQASLDWIEEEKYYNRLSTQEELEAYEQMQKRYAEGSEQRMAIDRKIYSLRNQLVEESYQRSMNWIEQEKYYNRMTLSDELAAYKRVQSRYAQGTEERKKMDREVYRVEREIYTAQKQYITDVQNVQEEANQRRIDLEQEYADRVKSINDKLAQDIRSANDKYQSSLESRTNSLYQSYGLFDEIKEREEVSGETLMKNLEDQVREFGEWQDILDSLSARGLDTDLIGELQEMGPSAIAQIKALNNMSDSELEKYAALWSIKHAQAREQAVGELEGLRIETQNTIAQLRVDADNELSAYQVVWQSKMQQIDIDANAKLEKLRQDFAEKVGLIKKDTEAEMEEMTKAAQAILTEAGWDETGQQIVTGLTEGVEENRMIFLNALTQMALEGVEAVKDTLDIHSPSRVFRELGNFTSLGFVNGITDYAKKSYDAGNTVAEFAKDGLSNAMQTITDYVNGNMETQPVIRPVIDLSNVMQGAGELNNMFGPSRLIALAGQTSLAFSANAGNNKTTIQVNNDSVVQAVSGLRGDVAELSDSIRKMQIVLDTGVLAGAMAESVDSALGQRAIYHGRGI